MDSLTSPDNQYWEHTGDTTTVYRSHPRTGMPNDLCMSKQRQHIPLTYFKTLSALTQIDSANSVPLCFFRFAVTVVSLKVVK